ncbi:hypothetical protein BHE90_016795 [Fusarium euwallaceae]|uniref:Protein kinase domain-containing protein n=1 Tax=Fusarium euwallaceae TaxID=1147111 RepID=A0A430KZD0_9HYPO|nr:hypothetical protein BHE90_016795 [Fusarium euwallaceae]
MGDPLSVLGAGVGLTSLIIQVVDECVKGYTYYVNASNMPEQYHHLQLRAQMEQQRFLNFATVAGLLYADGDLSATLKVNRSILLAVLAEIRSVFETHAAANGRYIKFSSPNEINWDDQSEPELDAMALLSLPSASSETAAVAESQAGLMKQSAFGLSKLGKGITQARKNLRKIVIEPKRLVWATVDKDRFEQMIARLAELNSFLTGLLDGANLDAIQEATSASYYEILQLKNDIKSLQELVQAFSPDAKGTNAAKSPEEHVLSRAVLDESLRDERERKYLKRLAELKIQYTEIGQMSENVKKSSSYIESIDTKLDLKSFTFQGSLRDLIQHDRRTYATLKGNLVWIEWKTSTSAYGMPLPRSAEIEMRLRLLTELLCFEKPSGFRAPLCHGYVEALDENDEAKFGIVFGIQDAEAQSSRIYTLYELLQAVPKPSLTARVSLARALAESIHNFHAINWLHKGIRSENISIVKSNEARPDLSSPYISGFELSRPKTMVEMTEKPVFDPLHDLYRHPAAQSSCPHQQYQKSYDMYSLGIVLIEIANWKRIENIMDLGDVKNLGPPVLQSTRHRLLGELDAQAGKRLAGSGSCLEAIGSELGEAYQHMVEICLRSDEMEEPAFSNESKGSIAIRLQRVVESRLVKKLRQLESALRKD